MSMADPFLPVPPPRDDDRPFQRGNHSRSDESEPDVFIEPEDGSAPESGEPPLLPTHFRTPTGQSVDPEQDIDPGA
ncbi:hypothetical protein HDC37_002186 [Microbacterium sp. AK009]|uniref:hypothetical protein n=1 Tax=Microbacterium sp. AK009 TaxID=2723068 RepID=UPI0015CB5965|nr:hypothetical protein [Microbacterium sp. AK009]NYF17358.1 hypothetical protein [Microbacterium sp. AK009]